MKMRPQKIFLLPPSSNDKNNPKIAHDGTNQLAVVDFDGTDYLENLILSIPSSSRNKGYSAFAVSRYTGGLSGRVITSSHWNWLMGHHDRHMGRYFFNGWVDQGFTMDLSSIFLKKFFTKAWTMRLTTARIWNDGNPGSYRAGSQSGSHNWNWFNPGNLCLVHENNNQLRLSSQTVKLVNFCFFKEIEESDRLLVEGYLGHKWGITLPSSHPWSAESPSFGEIVTEGVTPVGFTGPTSSPIAINLGPANLRQSTASLTGQLINPGRGILKSGEFSPQDYPGLELWLDTSAANGVEYDPDLVLIQFLDSEVVQEVVFHLDANDSDSITLSDDDVAEWMDKSGNGYDMIAQGHPRLINYGYGTMN